MVGRIVITVIYKSVQQGNFLYDYVQLNTMKIWKNTIFVEDVFLIKYLLRRTPPLLCYLLLLNQVVLVKIRWWLQLSYGNYMYSDKKFHHATLSGWRIYLLEEKGTGCCLSEAPVPWKYEDLGHSFLTSTFYFGPHLVVILIGIGGQCTVFVNTYHAIPLCSILIYSETLLQYFRKI